LRITLWTNAAWTMTGYAGQARQIARRLRGDGHEVAIIANFGLSGATLVWDGIPHYGLREARQNADCINAYNQHFQADLCISLYDVWALPPNTRQLVGVPWAAMVPVDGAPINKYARDRLRGADYIIAYSQFGRAQLKDAGFDPLYAPHGVDLNVFKPGDKAKAQQEVGLPQDRFIISIVAANKGYPARKGWPELLAAFKMFHDIHPEALLYCHTTKQPYGSGDQGIYFDVLMNALQLPGDAMAFPLPGNLAIGLGDEQIAKIYQASDVMALPSMGEGFCLPLLEAQACGIPVLTQRCSSTTELCVNGIAIEPLQPFWVAGLEYWWQLPSIGRIIEGLEELYTWDDEKKASMREAGLGFVAANYDYDVVWNRYWKPIVAHIEATLW